MHSVIAASVREQQKEHLYDISRPFIDIMTDELDFQKNEGREYEKAYLIPFSWSVADIMENHWNNEYNNIQPFYQRNDSMEQHTFSYLLNFHILNMKEHRDLF